MSMKNIRRVFFFSLVLLLIGLTACAAAEAGLETGLVEGEHQHKWAVYYEQEPTCTEYGFREKFCTECEAWTNEEIKPLGHMWIQVYEEATCSSDGYMGLVCARCGEEDITEIPRKDHAWQALEEKSATCTEYGLKEMVCEYCGAHSVVETKPLGHAWEEVNERATCQSAGFTGMRCSRCGLKEGKETPQSGHDYGPWQVVSDDCLNGYEQRVCSRCGLVHKREYKGDSHTWGEWAVTTPATADREGEETRICEKCGIWETRAIPALEFVFGMPGTEGLFLTVNQTSFSSTGFEAYDEVGFNWTIVNATGQGCVLKGIACRQGNGDPGSAGNLAVPISGDNGVLSGAANVTVFPFEEGASGLSLVFQGYVTFDDGTSGYTNHVRAVIPVTGSRSWTMPSVTSPQDVSVQKTVLSSPRDPAGYQLGETITYQVTVTNQGATTIQQAEISDPVADRDSASSAKAAVGELAPGASYSFTFRRTVGAMDIAAGFIANTAFASWQDPSSGETIASASNTVVVPTLTGVSQPGLTVVKQVLSAPSTRLPSGDLCFVPGDTIQYEITISNPTGVSFQNVRVYDALYLGTLNQFASIAAGETKTVRFAYTVTAADAAAGAVSNMAAALYEDAAGAVRGAFSASVSVPAGDPASSGVSLLEISKRELSSPRNGTAYQAGETIQYEITIKNAGTLALRSVTVMDSLARTSGGVLDTVSNLLPGQSAQISQRYTVTSADTRRAALTSRASAVYTAADGTVKTAVSAPAASVLAQDPSAPAPTANPSPDNGEDEGEEKLPTSKEKDEQPPIEESEELPVRLEGETETYVSCRVSIVAKGSGANEYSTVRCAIHEETYRQVMEKIADASESEQKEIWEQAAEAFKQDISDLYAACLEAATTSGAQTAVLTEEQLYFTQAENYRACLLLAHPEDETLAARAYAEELMRKCAQLCYEVHCAPEMRPDSYAALYAELTDVDAEGVCVRREGGTENTTCVFCLDHAGTEQQVTDLVLSAATAQDVALAWKQGEKLWRKKMDQIADALFLAAASDQDKMTVYCEQQSFYAWLDAREQFLKLLYADQPETVAEVIAREIWERTLSLCHYTEGLI